MAWKGWDLDPLLIEADPHGGVLGHRFGVSGTSAQRNLMTFAIDTRRAFRAEAMSKNLNEIAGFDAILAPVDPARSVLAIQQASPVISERLAPVSRPVVADLGRIHQNSAALRLARAADVAYIVMHPTTDQIQASLFQLNVLRLQGLKPQLILVGQKPFHADEVSATTEAPVAAVLPFRPQDAVALSGGKFKPGPFKRSPLWRSIVALARPLALELATAKASAVPEEPADYFVDDDTQPPDEARRIGAIATASKPPPPPPPGAEAQTPPAPPAPPAPAAPPASGTATPQGEADPDAREDVYVWVPDRDGDV